MDFPIVLVRFGEIGLKSKRTRVVLRRMLRRNILNKLKTTGLSYDSIEDTWERLILHTDQSELVASALSKVFGVVSTSPAVECSAEIDEIGRITCNLAREKLRQGQTFAIRVRRIGKHEFNSKQVAGIVGSSVIETLKKDKIEVGVDLDSPDHELLIEIRQDRCFVYHIVVKGVGGLPFGSQGRIVSRLSDYNSIIATWLMMKRGCAPTLAVFDSEEEVKDLVDLAMSTLLPYSVGDLPVIKIDLSRLIEETSLGFKESLEYVALNEIALLEGADGIVTGERLEPSDNDQTEMVRTKSSLVDFPIFHPLVGFDHDYVRHLAQRIGEEKLALKIDTLQPKRSKGHVREFRNLTDSKIKGYRETIRKEVVDAKEEFAR